MTFAEPKVTLHAVLPKTARAEATGSLVVQLDDGRRAVLPRRYAEASTSLGYALTVFRSQGITVDHTFGLGGDSLFQEAGYTALSRGRLSNNLYVASPENPRWEIGHHAEDLTRRDALESLAWRPLPEQGADHGPGPPPDLAGRVGARTLPRLPGARRPRKADCRSRALRRSGVSVLPFSIAARTP